MKTIKLQVMISEMMRDFMKPDGTYQTWLHSMFFHISHVKVLGTKFCGKMCYDVAEEMDGVMVVEIDYSERYQPV